MNNSKATQKTENMKMTNHSFNPFHKEYLNWLSEIAKYYEAYSIDFAQRNGGEPHQKFAEIYSNAIMVANGIMEVISYEIQENEFYCFKKETVETEYEQNYAEILTELNLNELKPQRSSVWLNQMLDQYSNLLDQLPQPIADYIKTGCRRWGNYAQYVCNNHQISESDFIVLHLAIGDLLEKSIAETIQLFNSKTDKYTELDIFILSRIKERVIENDY